MSPDGNGCADVIDWVETTVQCDDNTRALAKTPNVNLTNLSGNISNLWALVLKQNVTYIYGHIGTKEGSDRGRVYSVCAWP